MRKVVWKSQKCVTWSKTFSGELSSWYDELDARLISIRGVSGAVKLVVVTVAVAASCDCWLIWIDEGLFLWGNTPAGLLDSIFTNSEQIFVANFISRYFWVISCNFLFSSVRFLSDRCFSLFLVFFSANPTHTRHSTANHRSIISFSDSTFSATFLCWFMPPNESDPWTARNVTSKASSCLKQAPFPWFLITLHELIVGTFFTKYSSARNFHFLSLTLSLPVTLPLALDLGWSTVYSPPPGSNFPRLPPSHTRAILVLHRKIHFNRILTRWAKVVETFRLSECVVELFLPHESLFSFMNF